MIRIVFSCVVTLAYFCSLPSAYLLPAHPNVGALRKGSTSIVFRRGISVSKLKDSPIDETPEYLAELDRLQKLKSNEFLRIIESSDISLQGLNDRKELERVLALEIVLRRKAVTSSPRVFAQELQKELAVLQAMSISTVRENLRKSVVEFPENATKHELRVLLARRNIEQKYHNQRKVTSISLTTPKASIAEPDTIDAEIYFKDVLYNSEKALNSVSDGLIAGMNSIRNITDSMSSTKAERDALNHFISEPRSSVADVDERPQDWLKEMDRLASFDEIMSWCATKPRSVIIDVLQELKVPVGRYMTYSAACTSLADHLMTIRQESAIEIEANNDQDASIDRKKMISKNGKKVVGDYAFEKDIWRRFAKKTVPNTVVGTTNFIGEMLVLVVTSITSVFKFNVPGSNHPVTLLEKLVQLLCTATAALGNALGLWAGSGRLSSRSVISLAVMYTIYQRKGIGGFLNAIMVTKLFTSFFNSLGIPAIVQKTTTAKIKQIEVPREEEKDDWSNEVFGSD